ncbi:MAG: polysaccharide biosynthesis protein [Clostridia bacterium]|nr:polysaccharide biosynthesis protein [Clostridia bacterium]
MKRVKRFAANALLMGAVTIFMRSVSVVFNAYVSSKIGAQGMGLYSLITSVYLFAVTLAGSGISLAVMRLVSEELARDDHAGVVCAMRRCLGYALFFGTLSFALLFFGADFLSECVLRDARTYRSLRVLSVALPFIALSNVFSGYFNAVRRVAKSASANLIEQMIKIALTVTLISRYAPRGIEEAVLSLVIGSAVSEGLSFLYLSLFYLADKRRHLRATSPKRDGGIRRRMLGIALPIALSSYLRSGLVTVEHILIPVGLRKHGADYESALASYGTVHGMVFPLILFPSAVCSTFSGLIVPELSELAASYRTVYGNKHICYIVRRALTLALFFGIGTAGVLLCFADRLGLAVYASEEAAYYIRIFAPLVPVMYLDTTVDGMLKGLGQQLHSMLYNIIDASMSVVLVLTLLPTLGIYGYVVCIYITELVNLAFSLSRLMTVTGAHVPLRKALVTPLICTAGASALTSIVLHVTVGAVRTVPVLVFGIVLCALIYVLLLRTTCAIDAEDSRWIRGILKNNT